MEISHRHAGRVRLLLTAACLAAGTGACARRAPLPEEAPPLPVRVERVERADFQPTLVLLGILRSPGDADLVAPAAGRLTYARRFGGGLATGTLVAAGEILVRIVNQDAEHERAEAELRLASAQSELTRYRRAFDLGVVAAAQLAQYQAAADLAGQKVTAARERLESLSVRSPLAGRLLVDRRLPPGGEVASGTLLARVSAAGPLRIEAQAAAADRELLHPGLAVRFTVPGRPELVGRGVIDGISPVLGPAGTLTVLARVAAADRPAAAEATATALPPGEGVEVQVELDRHFRTFTVPVESLLLTEAAEQGTAAVYAAEGSVAHRRLVRLGGRSGDRVEIVTGLSTGDEVVVGGAALLSDGVRIERIGRIEIPGAAGGSR